MIADSTKVTCRKVGRGTVQAHSCAAAGYDCSQHQGQGGQHRYAVAFETGRYRGITREVWLRDSERIPRRPRPAITAAAPRSRSSPAARPTRRAVRDGAAGDRAGTVEAHASAAGHRAGAITSWMDQAVLSAVLERGAAEREELRALLDGGRL